MMVSFIHMSFRDPEAARPESAPRNDWEAAQ
jgi:hypothetical protein